jgi:site-specific recombinase XerD
LTPASIDVLAEGYLADPLTPGLTIEVGAKGQKTWRYRRRITSTGTIVKLTLGRYPRHSIADARQWASELNAQVEIGVDPRAIAEQEVERAKLTVAYAHGRYMQAVREGRASRAKKLNKPRTIAEKLEIYNCDIAPKLAKKIVFDVTEEDLTRLVLAKGKRARVRANRLATELKVFFGWASSLRGTEIGLPLNPAARLADLKFPEAPRNRILSLEEIGWFLRALAPEPKTYQRGMLLWLLTAARISEVIFAQSTEYRDGIWTIPAERVKNGREHRIALGPWGQSLIRTNSVWVFPSARIDGPRVPGGWYKARNRVLKRMAEYAGRPIERWTPHDLRRTARSNTKRLGVDFETAEAMLNHTKRGLERIYDGYDLAEEKREWFLTWENEIARIARAVGAAEELGVPPHSHMIAGFSELPRRPPLHRWPTRERASPSRRARRRV